MSLEIRIIGDSNIHLRFEYHRRFEYIFESIFEYFRIFEYQIRILNGSSSLLYKSGNKVVDDFFKYAHNLMEFVPYDQFKVTKFIANVESYEATWVDGSIWYWNDQKMNFVRCGPMQVILRRLNNSKKSLLRSTIHINLIIIHNIY